mmetsp:Transcript_63419/g.175802  ORF Transcript_63419/g.175802 Transcript_63419/m.175802 type:complete len:206 (-) Transcript_63419:252-869(-)
MSLQAWLMMGPKPHRPHILALPPVICSPCARPCTSSLKRSSSAWASRSRRRRSSAMRCSSARAARLCSISARCCRRMASSTWRCVSRCACCLCCASCAWRSRSAAARAASRRRSSSARACDLARCRASSTCISRRRIRGVGYCSSSGRDQVTRCNASWASGRSLGPRFRSPPQWWPPRPGPRGSRGSGGPWRWPWLSRQVRQQCS